MSCANQLTQSRDATVAVRSCCGQSDAVDIRRLSDLDAHAFRRLRLHALREFPESFGITYAEERDTPWPDFLRRFQDDWTANDNVIFGAFQNELLVGSLGLRRWEREKQRHKAYIWILYVAPEARANGIGRRLLSDALQYARNLPELTQIQLSVAAENRSARSLYISFGFEPFGRERDALKLHDGFIDLELMALQLSQ